MKRRVLATALLACTAALLSGCASGPKFEQMQSSLPQLGPGFGRIFIYRQTTMVGAAHVPEIRLNGERVGTAPVTTFFYLDRPAGSYVVSAKIDSERSMSFVLAAGETKYVRAYVNFGLVMGNVAFELHPPAEGAAHLLPLSYTGGPAR